MLHCHRLASLPPLPFLPPSKSNSLSPPLLSSPSPSLPSFNQTIHFLSHTLRINPYRALSLNPSLRTHPLPSLQSNHSLLLSIGFSPPQISHLFSSHPYLLTHPFDPSIQFLLSIFPPPSLSLSIRRCPGLLSSPVDTQLSPALDFLERLAIPITPNTSILLVANVESTLLPKVEFLQSLGWSNYEVKSILRRCPRILTYSIENNLKPKVEFLKDEMKLDIRREIRRFPQYFAFNLENRIKRRYWLVRENGVDMGLGEMLRTSDEDFKQRILDRKLEIVDGIVRGRART